MSLLTNQQQPKGFPFTLIIIAGLIVVVFVLVVGYFYIQSFQVLPVTPQEVTQEDASQKVVLEGTLFASITKVDPETGVYSLIPTAIDMEKGTVTRFPVTNVKGEDMATVQYSFSPAANNVTYLGLPLTEEKLQSKEFDTWNVYRANLFGINKEQEVIANAIQGLSVGYAGDDTDYYRETPVVSQNGDILFMSLSKDKYMAASSSLSSLNPEDWNIIMIDADEKKYVLASGMSPKWVNGTQLAYLKNDGVYLTDVQTHTEFKVWETPVSLTAADGFDVSNDGTYFALTVPSKTAVYIVEVEDWKKQMFFPTITLPLIASNPVFSPHNENLALVVLYKNASTGTTSSQIRYFSLQAQDFLQETFILDETLIESVYLTDWF